MRAVVLAELDFETIPVRERIFSENILAPFVRTVRRLRLTFMARNSAGSRPPGYAPGAAVVADLRFFTEKSEAFSG
jgi:hypothetical protein